MVRNVLVMSLRLSDHNVLHNIESSSSFFNFAQIFSLFSLVFRSSELLEFKEFIKTIIPFAERGDSIGLMHDMLKIHHQASLAQHYSHLGMQFCLQVGSLRLCSFGT